MTLKRWTATIALPVCVLVAMSVGASPAAPPSPVEAAVIVAAARLDGACAMLRRIDISGDGHGTPEDAAGLRVGTDGTLLRTQVGPDAVVFVEVEGGRRTASHVVRRGQGGWFLTTTSTAIDDAGCAAAGRSG